MIEFLENINLALDNANSVVLNGAVVEAHFDFSESIVQQLKELPTHDDFSFFDEKENKIQLEQVSGDFSVELNSELIREAGSESAIADRIIMNRKDPVKSLDHNAYFLRSINRFLTPGNPSFEKLSFLAKLTEFLTETSDHIDGYEYIFWSDGKTLVNSALSDAEFWDLKTQTTLLNELMELVCAEEHSLERKSLFKLALKKSIGDSGKDSMSLFELVEKLDRVKRFWSEGYYAYLHDLDFDEIREKTVKKVDATHDAIGQVLSSAQIRVLAIPVAIIVGASQFTKINDIGFMLTALVGLTLLVSAGYLLFVNADEDVKAVESRFKNWVKGVEKSKVIDEFDEDIKGLKERISRQKRRISFLKIFNLVFSVSVLVVAFTSVAFSSENNYGNAIVDKVTSIVDSDTVRANIKNWLP
jgi:hypothetical protein